MRSTDGSNVSQRLLAWVFRLSLGSEKVLLWEAVQLCPDPPASWGLVHLLDTCSTQRPSPVPGRLGGNRMRILREWVFLGLVRHTWSGTPEDTPAQRFVMPQDSPHDFRPRGGADRMAQEASPEREQCWVKDGVSGEPRWGGTATHRFRRAGFAKINEESDGLVGLAVASGFEVGFVGIRSLSPKCQGMQFYRSIRFQCSSVACWRGESFKIKFSKCRFGFHQWVMHGNAVMPSFGGRVALGP